MKKNLVLVFLLALLLLTGCRSIYESEYSYSEKFAGEIGDFTKGSIEIKNYANLQNTILALIENGEKSASLVFSRYVGSPADDLAKICYEIRVVNPLGNFALSDISYDTSRIVSYYTADVSLEFKRTKDEIALLSKAVSVSEADTILEDAVSVGRDTLLLRCRSTIPSEEYFEKVVQNYYYENLSTCLFMPELSMLCYPETGSDRIYELSISYEITGAPELEKMRYRLSAALDDALNAVSGDMTSDEGLSPEAQLGLNAARYICSLNTDEAPGSFPDTAYGLFCEHSASSEGLALAYKLLCDSLEIPCIIVEGTDLECLSNDSVYWNIIKTEDNSYHMLLDKKAGLNYPSDEYRDSDCFFLTDDALHSRIPRDSDEYPLCIGPVILTDGPEETTVPPALQQPDEMPDDGSAAPEGNPGHNDTDSKGETENDNPSGDDVPDTSHEGTAPLPTGDGGEKSSPS